MPDGGQSWGPGEEGFPVTDWKEEERHPSERLSQPWEFFPGEPGALESPVTFAKGTGGRGAYSYNNGKIIIIITMVSVSLLRCKEPNTLWLVPAK